MRRYRIGNRRAKTLPTFKIPYGNGTVEIPYPEKPEEGKCDACGRSRKGGQIKSTVLDHWKLAYQKKTFVKEPWKAIENLNELCMADHKLRLAFKELLNIKEEDVWKVTRVGILMPEEMKRKLDKISRAWLMARKNDKSKRTDLRTFT